MIAYQTWENVLSHIKLGLGAKVMKIEFDDDELIEILEEHVIPLYSKFDKHQIFYLFDQSNNVKYDITLNGALEDSISPVDVYEFGDDFNWKVLDIEGKIDTNSLWDEWNIAEFAMSSGDITDYLVLQNYRQIAEIIQPVDSWKFIPPNQIRMIKSNQMHGSVCGMGYAFIAVVNVIHKNTLTMDPTYFDYFKDLALAKIMMSIGNIRIKYQDFSTPQGQVRINAAEIKEDGKQLWKDTMEEIKNTPPDLIIDFF